MKTIHTLTALLFLSLSMPATFADDVTSTQEESNNSAAVSSKSTSSVSTTIECNDGPCKTVYDTTKEVMEAVNNNVSSNKILTIVSPKFDFQLMTKFAMGNNWKLTTKKQQDKLVPLFRQLLTYTYSNAWCKFRGAKITITNSQINLVKNNTSNKQVAAVISQVLLPNSADNQPIKVEYDLANTGSNNAWLAYDIKIADASLVTTYRNQFNDIIQNSQVDGLITQLQTKVTKLKQQQTK